MKSLRSLPAISLTFALSLALNPMIYGQAVNATVLGTIDDSSGAVVSGAKVNLTEITTNIAHTAQTNQSGNYEFVNVPPGQYKVSVEHQGFKKEERSPIDVEINSTVRVNMRLQAGAVSETVEVTGELPMLQTDRADISEELSEKQVEDLPLGTNRNFQNLLDLIPGTTGAHREHSAFFNSQDSLSTEANGQTRHFNNLMIEGVDNNHRTGLLQVYIPPAEAITTVNASTNNYAAEFGRAGGAVTNVQLKSGSNAFHGSVYEFNKVSALSARSYFNRPPNFFGRTTYNYYGGTIGGPIFKNKTFFFVDILRIADFQRQHELRSVPIAAYRNGDFRSVLPNVIIYDPATGDSKGQNRQPIVYDGPPITTCPAPPCANVIDPNRISPIAQRILALVPLPNKPRAGTNNNFEKLTSFMKNTDTFDIKIDHNRTQRDRYAFRFSRQAQEVNQEPLFGLAGGPNQGGFLGTGVQHIHSTALNNTHIFTPTLIAETRLGVSHYRNITHQSDYGSKASEAIGIKGVNLNAFTSGLTFIDIGGLSSPLVGYSASQPWDRGETNINLVSSWTKIHANHTFRWGGDFRRLRDDLVQAQTFGPRGKFTFRENATQLNRGTSGSTTNNIANSMAAFLLDAPFDVGRDISFVSGAWRESELFTFVQDKWQVSSKLTLDGGLRWELYFPPTSSHPGRYSNYDPYRNVLVIAGVGGNPMDSGRTMDYHYFAPRLGIAYRFTEKTVIRGGFGISYEPWVNNQYAFNFPVRQNQGYTHPNSFARAQSPDGTLVNMGTGFPAPTTSVIPADGILRCQPPTGVIPTYGPCPVEDDNIIDKGYRQPYVESWNVAVQRALPKNFVFDMAYVANHGVRQPVVFDLNAPTVPGVAANGTQIDTCLVRPLCKLAGGPQFGRTTNADFLFKSTTSNYNSLQVRLNRRWSAGFTLTTSYAYGKGLAYRSGNNDDGRLFTNLDFQRNYSLTSFNRTHNYVQSFVYELPFGKKKPWVKSGWASRIVGGWQISGVLTRRSGSPLQFHQGTNTLNAPGSGQTPFEIAPLKVLGGIDNDYWFDPRSFCRVSTPNLSNPNCPVFPNGTQGNMGRYSYSGPGIFNLDAALFRKVAVTERVGVEFRADAFSVTNTPRFNNPDVNVSDSSTNASNPFSGEFGRIRGTSGGNRSVQLSAKLKF